MIVKASIFETIKQPLLDRCAEPLPLELMRALSPILKDKVPYTYGRWFERLQHCFSDTDKEALNPGYLDTVLPISNVINAINGVQDGDLVEDGRLRVNRALLLVDKAANYYDRKLTQLEYKLQIIHNMQHEMKNVRFYEKRDIPILATEKVAFIVNNEEDRRFRAQLQTIMKGPNPDREMTNLWRELEAQKENALVILASAPHLEQCFLDFRKITHPGPQPVVTNSHTYGMLPLALEQTITSMTPPEAIQKAMRVLKYRDDTEETEVSWTAFAQKLHRNFTDIYNDAFDPGVNTEITEKMLGFLKRLGKTLEKAQVDRLDTSDLEFLADVPAKLDHVKEAFAGAVGIPRSGKYLQGGMLDTEKGNNAIVTEAIDLFSIVMNPIAQMAAQDFKARTGERRPLA